MKFKIIDKKSEAWKKVMGFWNEVKRINKENQKSIESFVGFKFKDFVANRSVFYMTHDYVGFLPLNKDLSNDKDWKKIEGFKGTFEPNKRTKKGKLIRQFISDLPKITCFDENEILVLEDTGNKMYHLGYTFKKDVILIEMQSFVKKWKQLDGLIEITESEFRKLNNGKKI